MEIDILYLVDRLENLITSSRRVPLVNQIMVKEADILSIIDQMRTSIPDEFKQARAIIHDKERILLKKRPKKLYIARVCYTWQTKRLSI